MGIYEGRQIHTKTGFRPIKLQGRRSGPHTNRTRYNNNRKCCKKKYFSDKLLEMKGDVKGTWKVLNSVLGKRLKTTQINSLVIDNQEITNPADIVTNLNKHFTNIAEKTLKESEQDYCRIKILGRETAERRG